MKFSDETLMAFADGELAEPAKSEVEQAMRTDPAVAAKVAGHQALRADVFGAFAGVLDEPVPARLQPAGTAAASAAVVQLDSARAARRPVQPVGSGWSWQQWGGMAASLAIGVFAGSLGLKTLQADTQLAERNGALVAQGKLEHALSQQLASAVPPDGQVRIGVSFVDKAGAFCRSFAFGSTAGLACRDGQRWQVPLLTESEQAGSAAYRQAASSMPPAVLDAIDARIEGQALDAGAERDALQRGWQRPAATPKR